MGRRYPTWTLLHMMSKAYEFNHQAVMLDACVNALAIRPDGIYVDCTAGGGGHARAVFERLSKGGVLVAIDKDPVAVQHAKQNLARIKSQATFHVRQWDFSRLADVLDALQIGSVDGILADLGVSSYQLDTQARGFGYAQDGPLDMRMNPDTPLTAHDVVNRYACEELARIFQQYGEERYADRIARAICVRRERKPFERTMDLAAVIAAAMPSASRKEAQHPARRSFQALRIEVNRELEALKQLLAIAVGRLADRGRLCVISFHSLEDRLVKNAFRSWENPCTCPRDFPHCVCGAVPLGKVITKRPMTATHEEQKANPRSRSAKMRSFERRVS